MPRAIFTPEWAEKIAFEYLESLIFCDVMASGCVDLYEFNDHRAYVVSMSYLEMNPESLVYQTETFIHELLHIFHYVWGLKQKESIIEKKTKKFCNKYAQFASKLFERIVRSNKCQGAVYGYISDRESYAEARTRVKNLLGQKFSIKEDYPEQLLLPLVDMED